MDIQKYIDSGILEQYCLGLLDEQEESYLIQVAMLYPEVKAELAGVELAMEKMAALTAIDPAPLMRQRVLSSLGFSGTEVLSLDNLPVINEDTDPQPWLDVLAHMLPDEPHEDFTCKVIREDDQIRQMLVISKIDVPEEEHDNLFESFFILKGRCECTIGENFYALGAGDFIEIPLNTPHNIRLTTPVVAAILQYRFV